LSFIHRLARTRPLKPKPTHPLQIKTDQNEPLVSQSLRFISTAIRAGYYKSLFGFKETISILVRGVVTLGFRVGFSSLGFWFGFCGFGGDWGWGLVVVVVVSCLLVVLCGWMPGEC
jgi:hypothetical protein